MNKYTPATIIGIIGIVIIIGVFTWGCGSPAKEKRRESFRKKQALYEKTAKKKPGKLEKKREQKAPALDAKLEALIRENNIDALIDELKEKYTNALLINSLAGSGTAAVEPLSAAYMKSLQNKKDKSNQISVWKKQHYFRRTVLRILGKIKTKESTAAVTRFLMDGREYDKLRYEAALALGNIGTNQAVEGLLDAFNDKTIRANEKITWGVFAGLYVTNNEKAYLAILKAKNPYYREERIIEKLAKVATEDSVDDLVAILKNDKNSSTRRLILKVLKEIGTDKAVNGLLIALNDSDYYNRGEALRFLGELGAEKYLDIIINLLKRDEESHVRKTALDVLGKIGTDKAVRGIKIILNDPDFHNRVKALKLLSQIGSDKSVAVLVDALNYHDYTFRGFVVQELGNTAARGQEKAVEGLIDSLNHHYPDVRQRSVTELGKIGVNGSKKVEDALIDAINHHDKNIRYQAVWALGRIGSPRARKAISPLLNSTDYLLRQSALNALKQADKNERAGGIAVRENKSDRIQTEAALIDVLKNSQKSQARKDAALALIQIGTEHSLEALIQAVKNDSNRDVRYNAMVALKRIGTDRAVEGISFALHDSDIHIRLQALRLLGELQTPQAVNAIILVFEDEDRLIRYKALEILGKIAGKDSPYLEKIVEALIRLIDDDDYRIRTDALAALAGIQHPKAKETIKKYRKNKNR